MITCTLGEKKYSVPMITGRVLREIGPAAEMYNKLANIGKRAENGEDVSADEMPVSEVMDVMVQWFCLLFGNQFTPDEFYDGYPADRVIGDISLAILAVQNGATKVLDSFPTQPEVAVKSQTKKTK